MHQTSVSLRTKVGRLLTAKRPVGSVRDAGYKMASGSQHPETLYNKHRGASSIPVI